jgi:predicted ATPase/DNA-binding SARP family transcriptional activator
VSTELNLLSRVAYRDQEISAPRLRGLLALLAGDLRAGCGTARLVDGLWPDEKPENPTKALQVLISRARAQLGSGVIVNTATGYRLALREDQVDTSAVVLAATETARSAAAGDHAAALAHAEAGLVLWDGATGDDVPVPDDPLISLRAERMSTYRSLRRGRALALSRLGRRSEAVGPLEAALRDQPRDEEVLVELLRCESATVGPAAALARYEAYRRSLRDELGTDPGTALQAMYQQLLRDSAPLIRHGVPHEPNPLLGRDNDITAVLDLMRTSRVTSIVGTGGLGKTRLANVVSRQAEQRVVHVVPLAGVTTDADVASEVASVLGVGDARRGPLGTSTSIVSALGPGPVLLVLDNCEHVVRGAAELVQVLVSMTQDVRVLTTSRAPLGLSSESVYRLPELDPATTAELFRQRARAARPGVDLPDDLVEELCRHLDGLPLAVELAAARVRVMSVAEIGRRLDDRFALLRGGARDAPQRHRTLQAVVDWSWHLLAPERQAAMRALSIFPSGFTADAAQCLLSGLLGADDALPILEDLVDQSLLNVQDAVSGTRFQMLETVREFSAAHRAAAGEDDRTVDAFLAWARDFGLARCDALLGAEPVPAAEQVRAEQDNLMQALRYALARDAGGAVVATSAVLACLWMLEAKYARMLALTDETAWFLSHFRPAPEFVEATRTAAAIAAGTTFMIKGPRALRALVALRRLPPAPPDTPVRAVVIALDAIPRRRRPDLSALWALCDSDEPLLAGVANCIASYIWETRSDPESALKAARRALESVRDEPSPWVRILTHSRVGELCLQVERGEDAVHHLTAALHLLEQLGPWSDVIGIRWSLVPANLQIGAVDEAERWLREAARDQVDDAYGMRTFDLGVRAEVRLARGDVEGGLSLWRCAIDQLANDGDPTFRIQPAGLDPWGLEIQAVGVVAHAQRGRVDLVADVVRDLPDKLSAVLEHPAINPPAFHADFPVSGALLLALAMVDLDRGQHASGVRLVALAERFHFVRGFQPTMSPARARQAAEKADRAAYAEAVSSYANLGHDDLRSAALSAIRAR